MKTVIFWILVGIVAAASAERIDKNECASTRDLPILGSSSEVHVDPCPEALNGESCILYKGSNATVTIKFTPEISLDKKIKSTISWVSSPTRDMTFRGMRPDACIYMPCPVSANEERTFAATLTLGSTLPEGIYPLKVKLQEARGRKRVIACQLFTIRLMDPPSN